MRGLARIISDERPGLVSKRPNNGDLLDSRFQWKEAIVLQQDHGFICQLARLCAMFHAVELLLIDLRVGNHVRWIEHAELDARGEEANERCVEGAFRKISLLDGIDIRLVHRFPKTRSERNALVVHAADDGE